MRTLPRPPYRSTKRRAQRLPGGAPPALTASRPAEVALRWQDLGGEWQEDTFGGLKATCVQHEIDHLDGVLCIDREEPAPETEA